MNKLQRLLVTVPTGKHDAFIAKHVTGATEADKYWDKLVFLEKTREIYTRGKIYGASGDISEIKQILSGYGDGGRFATVQSEIDAIVTKLTQSNLINLSYNTQTGEYDVEDTISLTYSNGYIGLGGGTSYGTQIGNLLPIADSGQDITYEGDFSYVAATPAAIREYLSSELGDIANAVTLEGNQVNLSEILDKTSGVTKKDVGNQYVMSTSYEFWFPAEGQEGAKQYKLKAGDNVLITTVSGGKVTGITAVERNLDGAVTATDVLSANQIIVGKDGEQGVQTTGYFIGTDTDVITSSSAEKTLATERGVAAAISEGLGSLNSSATYSDNYVSYAYTQTNGQIESITLSTYIASITHDTSEETIIVDGAGLVDGAGASAIISYVTSRVNAIDVSYTTVGTNDSSYITIAYTAVENDLAYTVDAKIVPLGAAVGMTYNEETGVWEGGVGEITHGLADAADVAAEMIADEEVIAAALNEHQTRISHLETLVYDPWEEYSYTQASSTNEPSEPTPNTEG